MIDNILWKRTRLCQTNSGRSVSLHSRKMEDAPKLLTIPKSECPNIWIRAPRHKEPESLLDTDDLAVLLERNLCGHKLAWEGQFEKKCCWDGKMYQIGNVSWFIETRLFPFFHLNTPLHPTTHFGHPSLPKFVIELFFGEAPEPNFVPALGFNPKVGV